MGINSGKNARHKYQICECQDCDTHSIAYRSMRLGLLNRRCYASVYIRNYLEFNPSLARKLFSIILQLLDPRGFLTMILQDSECVLKES